MLAFAVLPMVLINNITTGDIVFSYGRVLENLISEISLFENGLSLKIPILIWLQVHGGNIVTSLIDVNAATIVIASNVKRCNELMFQRLTQNIILPEALYILLSNPATESIERFTHLDFVNYGCWPTDDNFVPSVEDQGPQFRTPENKDMQNDVNETGDEAGVDTVKLYGFILPSESREEVKFNQSTKCDADAIDQLASKRQQKVPGGIRCEVERNGPIECTLNVSIPEHSCTSLNDSLQSSGQSMPKQEEVYTSLLGKKISILANISIVNTNVQITSWIILKLADLELEDKDDEEDMRIRNYFQKKEAETKGENEKFEAQAYTLMDEENLAKKMYDPKFRYRQTRALAFKLAGTRLNMSVSELARVVYFELVNSYTIE